MGNSKKKPESLNWLLSKGSENKDEIKISGNRGTNIFKNKGISLTIGRFPNGWLKTKGQRIVPEGQLSISDLLSELKVTTHTAEIFPWAFANNSFWIYYAYFNGAYSYGNKSYSDAAKRKLEALLIYLEDQYDQNRAGVGRKSSNKKQWIRVFESAQANHWIEDYTNEMSELFKRIRYRIDNNKHIYKRDVRKFKKLWVSQSKELTYKLPRSKRYSIGSYLFHLSHEEGTASSYHIIGRLTDIFLKNRIPSQKFANVLAGYHIIRGLYGTSFNADDQKNSPREIKELSKKAVKLFHQTGLSKEKYYSIYQDLRLSLKNGIPMRKEEAEELAEEKSIAVFKNFRFNSFLKINRQLFRVLNEY